MFTPQKRAFDFRFGVSGLSNGPMTWIQVLGFFVVFHNFTLTSTLQTWRFLVLTFEKTLIVKLNLRDPNALFTFVQNEFVFFTSRLQNTRITKWTFLKSWKKRKSVSFFSSFHTFYHASISDVSQSLNANAKWQVGKVWHYKRRGNSFILTAL